jgi:hypothetical protein
LGRVGLFANNWGFTQNVARSAVEIYKHRLGLADALFCKHRLFDNNGVARIFSETSRWTIA